MASLGANDGELGAHTSPNSPKFGIAKFRIAKVRRRQSSPRRLARYGDAQSARAWTVPLVAYACHAFGVVPPFS